MYNNSNSNNVAQITFLNIPINYPKGALISLTLTDSIINPAATKSYSSFTIKTYDEYGYIIDGIFNSISMTLN